MSGTARNRLDPQSFETTLAATGRAAETGGAGKCAELESIRLRQKEFDLRAAEAVLLAEPVADPIQLAATFISRGALTEAQARIDGCVERDLEPMIRAELDLERARLASYRGEWREVGAICSGIPIGDLSALSQMALHQISANAAFESGDRARAERALCRLDALGTLFPFGQIPFYAAILRAKLVGRLEAPRAFASRADALWRDWKANPERNLDELHALLRLAIFGARLAHRPHADLAAASLLLARAIGDETYVALGWADFSFSLRPSDRSALDARVSAAADSQPRLRALLAEIAEGGDGISDTARAIREFPDGACEPLRPALEALDDIDAFVLVESGVRVDLTRRRADEVRLQPRSRAILDQLAAGPVSRAELFRRVWGLPNFAPDRHDSAIRTAMKRLRAQAGLDSENEAGLIRLERGSRVLRG